MHTRIAFPITLLILAFGASVASSQTSSFTYDGRLSDGGSAANGNYDFEFKLFDAVSSGSQQGSTIQKLNVPVANGLFTVGLDFGAAVFTGASRFLEISVRASGVGSFTVLSPRQELQSAPYAIKSAGAASADSLSIACVRCVSDAQISGLAGSKITGAIPVVSLPAGSASYIQNTTAPQSPGDFNISGTGTANTFNAGTQYNIGGTRVLSIAGTNNVFAGEKRGFFKHDGGWQLFFWKRGRFCEHNRRRELVLWSGCRRRNDNRTRQLNFWKSRRVCKYDGRLKLFLWN